MRFIYSTGIQLYKVLVHLISPFHKKAKKWIDGRKNWETKLKAGLNNTTKKVIWFHFSSLGEYLQGEPILQSLNHEDYFFLGTFFSPSGYENIPSNSPLNHKAYLPIDTKTNAKKFLDIVNPYQVFFVKYDIWPFFIQEADKRKIPLYLLAAQFRSKQIYFKWYGNFFLKAVEKFDIIFHQYDNSKSLFPNSKNKHFTVGDPRFDKALTNARENFTDDFIEQFCKDREIVVFGSAWEAEVEWAKYLLKSNPNVKCIIAPHETHKKAVNKYLKILDYPAALYSQKKLNEERVLIIDSIGILRYLYRYGAAAVIGGGFTGALHNIIEAVAYGIPVFFGNKHDKFPEARELLDANAALDAFSPEYGAQIVNQILLNNDQRLKMNENAIEKCQKMSKATQKIVEHVS